MSTNGQCILITLTALVSGTVGYAIGASGHTPYEFLRDQGSLIAGILALVAGAGAYLAGLQQVAATRRAADQQVDAINQQNEQLKRSEKRTNARQVVSAGRILEGILKIVDDSINPNQFSGPPDGVLGTEQTKQILRAIETPPYHEVMEYLEHLGPEIIDNYFLLCKKIENIKMILTAVSTSYLKDELLTLKAILNHIREEIAEESKMALAVLAD